MKYCKECNRRELCVKVCTPLEDHLTKNVEIQRNPNEISFTELGFNELEPKHPYPEPGIVLTRKDWIYFVRNYHLTPTQKKYLYLYFWKNLTYEQIGNKYNVSHQTVHQTIQRFRTQ